MFDFESSEQALDFVGHAHGIASDARCPFRIEIRGYEVTVVLGETGHPDPGPIAKVKAGVDDAYRDSFYAA